MIGNVSSSARRLVQTTHDALFVGIHAARPGGTVTEIGRAFDIRDQSWLFGRFIEYQGHGIGRSFIRNPGYHISRP